MRAKHGLKEAGRDLNESLRFLQAQAGIIWDGQREENVRVAGVLIYERCKLESGLWVI
jgi:hypothetical protein